MTWTYETSGETSSQRAALKAARAWLRRFCVLVLATCLLLPPFADAQQATHAIGTPQDFFGDGFDTSVAGIPVNPANLGAPGLNETFSTCAHIGAAFTAPSAGQTFFSQAGGLGLATFNQIGSSPSPFNCSSSGLAIKLANYGSGWVGGEISSIPYYGFSTGSLYQGPGDVRVTATFPAPPAGLCPWVAIWFESALSQPSPSHSKEWDLEACINGATNTGAQLMTMHSWPGPQPSTTVGGAGHMYQSWALPFNMFDGATHVYDFYTTTPVGGKAWQYFAIDGVWVVRFRLNSADMEMPMNLLVDIALNYPITSPATTSSTYTGTINQVQSWGCPSTGCVAP